MAYRMKILALSAFFLWSGFLFGAVISTTDFEQKNGIKVPDEQLLINIQQRPGARYDRKLVNSDIKRLYETGNFSDVSVNTVDNPDGSVALKYNLVYKPRVKSLKVTGNAKYSYHDLAQEITLLENVPLNENKLQQSINNLREFYRSKGYHDATVDFKLHPTQNPEEIEVQLLINENLRLKINNVNFEGNKLFSNFKLKWAIQNRYSPFSRFFEVGLLNREELELDKARLRELYWNEGYLDFEVKDLKIIVNADDPEYVDLLFTVDEGEKYKVGEIKISGNTVFLTDDLVNLVQLRSGDDFRFERENGSSRNISNIYEELGYADIECKPERRSDFEKKTVDINFDIKEGTKYSVRNIVITGNAVTKDKVIRRELAIQPGDPVDRNRIEASQARLMGMGYFNSVAPQVTNADAVDEKDVTFTVDEKDMFNFKFGAGFSDVNSLMGMVELSNNNFDLLDPLNWFTGGGQRLRVQGIVGIERFGFNVDFSEPWLFDIPLRFDVNGYMTESIFDYWREERVGVRTSLTKKVFDDFTTLSGAYKFEAVRINHMNSNVSPELKQSARTDLVSQFSVMIDRDTRDSLLMPTSGYNVNLLGAISPNFLGSSENFYRLEAKGSLYYPLFDKAIILMLGGRIGTIGGMGNTEEAPLYERYFLGGGDSIRGFDFRQISPLDSKGYTKGGQSMLLVTTEISHPIWDFIRGAVFMDMGNVWENSWQMGDINMGVGYGLRIVVPYLNAPIRLDLAYPVINNQRNASSKLRFHFNMGFTF